MSVKKHTSSKTVAFGSDAFTTPLGKALYVSSMSKEIELVKGNVYFYAGFADSELTIPVIETWVYQGFEEEYGHVFRDIDGSEQYCFSNGITTDILDKKNLSEWLLEDHSPQSIGKDYVYKNI